MSEILTTYLMWGMLPMLVIGWDFYAYMRTFAYGMRAFWPCFLWIYALWPAYLVLYGVKKMRGL